jgi:hypothetical protein
MRDGSNRLGIVSISEGRPYGNPLAACEITTRYCHHRERRVLEFVLESCIVIVDVDDHVASPVRNGDRDSVRLVLNGTGQCEKRVYRKAAHCDTLPPHFFTVSVIADSTGQPKNSLMWIVLGVVQKPSAQC